MTKISIAFLAAVSLASFGCPKKSGSGEAIAKLADFKDRMCTCKDKACSDKVSEDMARWGQGATKPGGHKAAVNEDEAKKMADLTGEMTECMTKIMTEAAGAATPPTGATPPAARTEPAAGSAAAGSAAPAAGSADPAAGSATK